MMWFTYDLSELKTALREVIPRCSPTPIFNKNSTEKEILDAVSFLEIQGKYNQRINRIMEKNDNGRT